jgi:hypothetical protein
MDLRTGILTLSAFEVVWAVGGICTALVYLVTGFHVPYITGTQVVLLFLDCYLLAVGAVGIMATRSREKVLAFDQRTLRLTVLMYRM